jgi:2'-5' RNA ligase
MEPLILTLKLDEAAFARFDGERRAWFPERLNFIPAHVTLFHNLPGEELSTVVRDLEREAAAMSAFPVEVSGLRKLGRGTAYELRSPDLAGLRARLAERWAAWLTTQDRQGFKPHVTVQNKVSPEEARSLYDRLAAEFRPETVRAEGLLLWRYKGGPWDPVGDYRLRGATPAAR